MGASPSQIVQAVLGAMSAKDKDAVMRLWADDAQMYNPRDPDSFIVGSAAIGQAMEIAFGLFKQVEWQPVKAWEDETSAVLETRTHQVAHDGTERTITQVFIVDVRDGQVTRWRSFGQITVPPR
jgi:ketosteroid isomerase-like protein